MDGPAKRDAGQHGRKEQGKSILVPLVVYHECEEDAEGYHERWHEAVDDKVARLAGHSTLHGYRRVGANGVIRVRVEVGVLWHVIADRVLLEVHVIIQLPDVFVERR